MVIFYFYGDETLTATVTLKNPETGIVESIDTGLVSHTTYSGRIKTHKLPINPIHSEDINHRYRKSFRLNFDSVDENTFLGLRYLFVMYKSFCADQEKYITYTDHLGNQWRVRIDESTLSGIVNSKFSEKLDSYSFNLTLQILEQNVITY